MKRENEENFSGFTLGWIPTFIKFVKMYIISFEYQNMIFYREEMQIPPKNL